MPEQPPKSREFSTANSFRTAVEMTELDAGKRRMPTKQESRLATMVALLGTSSRPAPTAGSARKKSF